MWQDFKAFAARGNVLDMAVGIVVGIAFGTTVQSFVNDVLMPPIGLAIGGVDFQDLFLVLKPGSPSGPYETLEAANAAGAVTLRWGIFVNAALTFLIVVLVMFLFVRYVVRRMEAAKGAKAEAAPRTCGFCRQEVAREASRCPHCTSEIGTPGGTGGDAVGGGAA